MYRLMKRGGVLLCCIFISLLGLHAQTLKNDPKLVSGVLKNGFHYYIYPSSGDDQQSAIQLFVNAGSLQEREDQLGLAHFVEHMAFNGSKHYPKNEVITYLESLGVKFGADLNAYTSYDETVYKITIDSKDPANLHKALDIVYDWAFNLSFDSVEIEKERGIIIEEWRTKQGASARMGDQTLPLIFYNSRYADRKPIGTLDILRNFGRPTILDFYHTWYRPDLMGIAIVTNQDVKATEKVIKQLFGKAKRVKKAAKREQYTLANHADTLFKTYTDREANSIDFSYITKLPASNPLKSEQDLLEATKRSMVNALIGKRFDRLAQLDASYKSASMSFSDLLLHNGLSIGGAVLYEGQVEAGIQRFLEEKERIVRFGFTLGEIADYKKQFVAQLNRGSQEKSLNSGLLLGQLKDVFFTGQIMMDRQQRRQLTLKQLDLIDSVVIQQHLQTYFKTGNTVVLVSGPERLLKELPQEAELKAYFASAAAKNLKPWKDEIVVPEHLLPNSPISGHIVNKEQIKEVNLQRWTMSNGAQVYLKKSDSRKDHLQITAFRKGGYLALDTADYVTAVFAKNIIGASGAGLFTRQALTKFLNGNSASATFMLAPHREGLSASANMKDVKTMFELLYLKWTQPRVDVAVFTTLKKQNVEAAKSKKYNVTEDYTKAINKAIGSDEADDNDISADRIEKSLQLDRIIPVFKERFLSAKDFDFVIIGDYHLDSIQSLVESYIGGLPSGEYNKEQRVPSYSQDKDQDILMYAGEADKATVNLFFQTKDVKYDYPDILLNELMENVLKVKLRKNLREKQSGVYGVGVSVSATSEPSSLMRSRINFTCEPARKDFLVEQAYVELKRIASNPSYFKEELENAKVQMLQSYNKQKDKDTFWSAELRNHIYYQFADWRFFTEYEQLLNRIKAEDISKRVQDKILNAVRIKAVLMPENIKK